MKMIEQTQEQTKASNPIIVTMENGEVKNFGERGRLLSSSTITDKAIEITFHIITGEQVVFTYSVEGLDGLLAKAAIFGFESKAKAATTGVDVAKIKEVIETKVQEFNAGIWSTRGGAGESLAPLNQLQTAYAVVHNIDTSTDVGIAKIHTIFSTFSKEDKSALYSDVNIKIQLATLKLNAALALQSRQV
jgi:hypothetical protein